MEDPLMDERRTFTVEEAARSLGISRALAYDLVRRGEIPSLRLRTAHPHPPTRA